MSEALPTSPSGLSEQLQDVVDELSELLTAPAVIEDTDFTLLAYCSQGLDVDPVRTASILGKTASAQVKAYFEAQGIRTATEPVHLAGDPAQQIAPRACLPARSGGRTLGYLWVLEPEARIDAGRLARAAPLARRAGELLARRQQGVLEHDRLVGELLSGDPAAAGPARAALEARGDLVEGSPIAVVVIRPPGSISSSGTGPGSGSGPGPASGSRPRGPAGTARIRVFAAPVGDGDPLAGIARRVARLTGDDERAGISEPGDEPAELPARRLEADVAARVALARPPLGRVVTWAELGFYRVAGQGPAAVAALLAGTAAERLLARAEPELVRTALVYLDEAGHVARAAAALSIHRQTLYYRLEKIEQLSGVSLAQGEARLQLHTGLALAEILPYLR